MKVPVKFYKVTKVSFKNLESKFWLLKCIYRDGSKIILKSEMSRPKAKLCVGASLPPAVALEMN